MQESNRTNIMEAVERMLNTVNDYDPAKAATACLICIVMLAHEQPVTRETLTGWLVRSTEKYWNLYTRTRIDRAMHMFMHRLSRLN
jgi:hypothetical protein